jgi:pimeloyl-ACP methyl ester carboxylesterase
MWVPMARALAHLGFTSLRFDLTGTGDTPTVPGIVEGHSYASSFVRDVQAAMDHLQRVLGVRRFVTVGLCSGAYLGFHASLADPRVVGAVLINPQTFNWREGDSLEINRKVTFMSTRFYKRAALDPKVWKRALKGQVNLRGIGKAMVDRWQKRAEVEVQRALRRLGKKDASGRVDVGDGFTSLLSRGADILMVYSGSDEGLDYLTSEVGTRLGRLKKRDRFTLEVIDGPDHTFTQLWAQDRLTSVVLQHIAGRFRKK